MEVELTDKLSFDKPEDSFLYDVHQGMQGSNEGLPNGFSTDSGSLNYYIHNVQMGRYYLIGADSGVGKTTLVDRAFVLEPLMYCKQHNLPIRIDYFSFEIGKSIKRAVWAGKFIYAKYGKRLPVSYILSQGKQRLKPEHLPLLQGVAQELEDAFKSINFIWESMTPTNIFKYLFRIATTRGKFHYETYFDSDEVEKKRITGYTPNNPAEPWIITIDHIALVDEEPGLSLKQNIDKLSNYLVFFRNICNCTVVPVQQFNSELGSIERQKYKKSAIAPQKSDFGDSKYTYRDADVVLGLLKPVQFDLTEFMGWDITQMGDYAVWVFLMKNRYGPTNKAFGLIPDPVVGAFHEIPKHQFDAEQYYALAQDLKREEQTNYGLG